MTIKSEDIQNIRNMIHEHEDARRAFRNFLKENKEQETYGNWDSPNGTIETVVSKRISKELKKLQPKNTIPLLQSLIAKHLQLTLINVDYEDVEKQKKHLSLLVQIFMADLLKIIEDFPLPESMNSELMDKAVEELDRRYRK